MVLPYPFLIATNDVKYPVKLSIQNRGIVKSFTIIGPIMGIVETRIEIPEKTLVINPITRVISATARKSNSNFSIKYASKLIKNMVVIVFGCFLTVFINVFTCFYIEL